MIAPVEAADPNLDDEADLLGTKRIDSTRLLLTDGDSF